jgi:hypothetical protein
MLSLILLFQRHFQSLSLSLHHLPCFEVCLDVTTTNLVVLMLVLTYNSYVLIYDYNIMVTMDGVLRRLIYELDEDLDYF